MKILYLPVKSHWFLMEQFGIKNEEYREITPYWVKRIMRNYPVAWRLTMDIAMETGDFSFFHGKTFGGYTHAELTHGYPRKDDTARRYRVPIREIVIGRGNPEWGAPDDRDVFIIRLGNKKQESL